MIKKTYVPISILGLCCLMILLATESIYAQEQTGVVENLRIPDPDHVQMLTTEDGSTLMGRIVEIQEDEIQFEMELGVIIIPISKIKNIKEIPVSAIRKGEYWFPNPNATRLYFASTGRCLKRGEGYFADYLLFFPMFAHGVTDNFTIAGGISLVPGVGMKQLFYFMPKVGLVSEDNFALSTGLLLVKTPGKNGQFAGILYGVGTFGSLDGSFTAGIGYGFVEDDLADKPMVMLGGEARVSRRMSFVTENWMFPGYEGALISYGIRLFGESISVDLAWINPIGAGSFFPGIPYIDFVYNF